MKKISNLWVAMTILTLVSGSTPVFASDPLSVFVSILPQKYFVEKIGGDRVDVSVMVRPGASPATYEPKPRQMADLSGAKLYFAIGVPFENAWLDKIAAASPAMRVIRTQDGVEKLAMKRHPHHADGDDAHDPHGEAGEQEGIRDPHIWLSPPLVMLQSRNILTALMAADPAHRADYEAGYRQFIREITELDLKICNIFAEKKADTEFMVFHPSWGYFASAYGLEQIPVEYEGKAPKPAVLQSLIARAGKEGVRVIFTQPQFSRKSAEMIASAIGGQVVNVDPLAADWAGNLQKVAEHFKAALR
ncbi:cation ABC transporter substrate-binding protein [Desulfonema ishimotonii]|uniref:Cation ABC transporter substrate-binding protein n=1 Tax=Desulfonema ishimotonii TaxID=45657 RepID=A0A401FVS0_9BACT|nr:zinc ABC transporter substrate-binding protein [Desulfonema ishimotonii]GBC61034.1 cation ABC transporter substrate-binding protein [Desulfonema ishimotonii]